MSLNPSLQRHIESFQRNVKKAATPQAFKALAELVAPRVLPGKRNLVYVLFQADRIGHLAGEPWHVKTLFGNHYDRIIIVTYPHNTLNSNPNVLKVLGPKFINIITHDPIIPLIGSLEGEHRSLSPELDFLIWGPNQLWAVFRNEFIKGAPLATFQLPNSMRLKGDAWMSEAGLDPSKPIVLLHARDAGYRPDLSHHGHRCVDICNYRLAIETLVENGYQVVRIGDPSNKPLEGYPSTVIDLPFHPLYDNFLDVYFAAVCVFAVNQSSGPSQLIRAFKKPTLMVNRVVDWDINPTNEILLFKHYVRKTTGKRMTYSQILEDGLSELTMDHEFDKADIRIEENSPEELKVAVEEFIEAVTGKKEYSIKIRDRFADISKQHEIRFKTQKNQTMGQGECFGFAYSRGNLSERALEFNREFLS